MKDQFRAITFDQALTGESGEEAHLRMPLPLYFCEFMVDSVYKDQRWRRTITKLFVKYGWAKGSSKN
jgi:hypothetical protein